LVILCLEALRLLKYSFCVSHVLAKITYSNFHRKYGMFGK